MQCGLRLKHNMAITLYSLNSHYWIWEACIISWYRKLSHFRRTWHHMFNLRNKDRLGKNVTSFFYLHSIYFSTFRPLLLVKMKSHAIFYQKSVRSCVLRDTCKIYVIGWLAKWHVYRNLRKYLDIQNNSFI